MFVCLVAIIFAKMIWIKALAKIVWQMVTCTINTVFINCIQDGFSLAKHFQIHHFSPISHLYIEALLIFDLSVGLLLSRKFVCAFVFVCPKGINDYSYELNPAQLVKQV